MSLHIDYRPKTLKEVEGNRSTVEALQAILSREKDLPHAFLFHGGSGCLHGDTVIYDPTDHSSIPIKDRFLLAKPFHVISLDSDGIPLAAQALPPVQYSEDRMFRVETPESVFFVTYGHRFLLDTGEYLSLKELIENGYEEVRLRSSSVFCQEGQPQDEPRCLKIIIGSQENYSAYCHLCGGQLLAEVTGDKSILPLQGDVPECTLASSRLDDQEAGEEHSHQNQLSGHPSTLDSSRQASLCGESDSHQGRSFQVNCESDSGQRKISQKAVSCSCPNCSRPLSLNHLEGSASVHVSSFRKFLSASLPPVLNSASGYGEPITAYTYIKQITEIAKEKYYDFHVPIYNNYWMAGVFHHNCGKTTLGRIVANELGCHSSSLREIDIAVFRSIDDVRRLREQARLRPMVGPVSVWILDEVHMLGRGGDSSKNEAQNALLKILEDTPPHVFFILCTTDPDKLLKTIRSRCMAFSVGPLSERQTTRLLQRIVKAEGVEGFPEEAYKQLHAASQGHPRRAVVELDRIIDLDSKSILKAIEQTSKDEALGIDLCRALLKREPWGKVAAVLRGLQDQEEESLRRMVLGYMNAVLLKEDNQQAAQVIECFKGHFFDCGKAGLTQAAYDAVSV